MINVIFICVIYSKTPGLTQTIKSIYKIDFTKYNINAHLAVWDNSSKGYGSNSLSEKSNNIKYSYYHTGVNERLSKIYNHIISEKSKEFDWVVILDDDSIIDESYMLALRKFISIADADSHTRIAIPRIYHQGNMISPGIVKGVRGYQLKFIDDGFTLRKDLVAMMSGTIIRLNMEALPTFDERLSFYGVDTKFFKDAIKKGNNLYILNCIMNHDSALRDSTIDYKNHIRRLENLFKARKIIYEDVPYVSIRLWCYKALFSLKLILSKKNIKYIKLIFS
ncbi:hypothetical protein PJX90_07880 [Klebsiella aerogenes]|uniref:hypothetical protein n=1 Tax=Klebsiella aerogenes TaxID=548 RepID=UPI001BCFD178|nr:hypothetical protein [Klebsiella aerogenes]HBQ1805927.1 hypothetical protein [Klebsiella aerogenes]HBQ2427778.1 hypothetical protein [Klebsiella aerogenes]HCM5150086.1 hypothetical protein [Klebsiella aerogenes]HDT3080931.1 hypothetical protein [Klebsiella aerogenes]HDU4640146.1 hypothetical protein [Klebsiella aerogenes]